MTPDRSLGAEPSGPGHRARPHDAGREAGPEGLKRAGFSVNAGGLPARTAGLFDRLAGRYDAWYNSPAGAAVFASELACLRPLLAGLAHPRAEIGTGSGRFAAALGAEVGVDPAAGPLALAAARGIRVVRGTGEQLPFRSGVLGAVLIVVTICFADDPAALLAEARRVIRHDGAVVLGEVFADSAWGRFYQDKAAGGHPFYSVAVPHQGAGCDSGDRGGPAGAGGAIHAVSAAYQHAAARTRPRRPGGGSGLRRLACRSHRGVVSQIGMTCADPDRVRCHWPHRSRLVRVGRRTERACHRRRNDGTQSRWLSPKAVCP